MDRIQLGSNLSHKHYRGRKHIAHRALCPLRPGGPSAPACSENVVQHQSNNSCKRARLGARQEARILAFTPHPLSPSPAVRPIRLHNTVAPRSNSSATCALTCSRPIQVALTLGNIASKLPTVTSTSRDTHHSALNFSSPGRPAQRRPSLASSLLPSLFSTEHGVVVAATSRQGPPLHLARVAPSAESCGNDY
jgi:hypothetical protein